MAIDTSSVSNLISEFRAIQAKDSVSPESLGYILQRIVDLLADAGLTAWQRQYLENLEAEVLKTQFSALVSLSESHVQFDGTDRQVTVYVSPKFNGAPVDAVVTGVSDNLAGKSFKKGSDGRYSATVTVPAPSAVRASSLDETFSVKVQYNHPDAGMMSMEQSATLSQYILSHVFTSPLDFEGVMPKLASFVAAAKSSAESLKGSHSVSIADGGEYVYFLVPRSVKSIRVSSSGFEVPLSPRSLDGDISVGKSTLQYWVFRTASKPQSSPFAFDVS